MPIVNCLKCNGHSIHIALWMINFTIRSPTDPPVVSLGGDMIGYVGEDLDFVGKVIHHEYDIQEYQWDFEDDGEFRTTLTADTTNRYNEIGRYEVTLRVVDIRLAIGETTTTVTIFPKRTGDHNISIEPQGDAFPGDKVIVRVNMSNAEKVDIRYVAPDDKEYPPSSSQLANGDYLVVIEVNRGFKKGPYDIKWRYYDHNNNATEWYEEKDSFTVKKHSENGNGNGNMMGYIIGAVVVVIIVLVIVAVMFMMYKKSLVRLEVAILFYRDGRVIFTHTPAQAGSGTATMDQSAIGQLQQTIQGQIYNLIQGAITKISESMMYGNCTVLIEQGMHTMLVVGKGFSGEENKLFRLAAQSGLTVTNHESRLTFHVSRFTDAITYCG